MSVLVAAADEGLGAALTRALEESGEQVLRQDDGAALTGAIFCYRSAAAELPAADLLASCRAAGIRTVLLIEDSLLPPDPEAARRLALLLADRPAGELVIRTGSVFGWDRRSDNLAMRLWAEIQAGQPTAVFEDLLIAPVHLGYLAEAVARMLQLGASGTVRLSNGEQLSHAEFCRRLYGCFRGDRSKLVPAAPPVPAEPQQAGDIVPVLGTAPPPLDACLRQLRQAHLLDTRDRADLVVDEGPAAELRRKILADVRSYYELAHAPEASFEPFAGGVPYAGRVLGPQELVNLVDSSLSLWLTMGPYAERFEADLKRLFDARAALFVSSGSSANQVAVNTLLSQQLAGPLQPGDEVITPAVTFPTTLAPIVQAGLVPVFVDAELGTYNVNPELVAAAVGPRTRAIMVPHTLGNPCDLAALCEIADQHGLYLIEDTCDALGSRYDGRLVGTFGDLGTLSFYPAHHITTGEGGCVIVNKPKLARIARSIRDWGRDCWCPPGESNSCGMRFGWQLGELPHGYDHKFTYSNVGFNLKATDMQAAVGVAQLARLDDFVAARRRNFDLLYDGLSAHADRLVLPSWDPRAVPAWFGFPVAVREAGDRNRLVQWLNLARIETRMIFGGNILRQPAYRAIRHRIAGSLAVSDRIMRDAFFLGVYPGLTDKHIEFVLQRCDEFFQQ
jgi:CDP-4-dehydro-6-deoxyglucose reductase, E1